MDGDTQTFLVFGDLHGRVLPAFRLASVWARDHDTPVAGLLQVGDLGYFPDLGRLDRATRRHAEDDPLELGVQEVVAPSEVADAVFADPDAPPTLWFTAGNHEDFDALEACAAGVSPRQPDFGVDAYDRLRCVRDGAVVAVPGGPRVGALWGVDGDGANARRNVPPRGYVRPRSATQLAGRSFDVLLSHDSPRDAVRRGYGSEDVGALLALARPAFAFFGHYHGWGRRAEGAFPHTQVYHLAGLELGGRGGTAEAGSVGVLTWRAGGGTFAYVEEKWLRTFARHNWHYR